MKKEFVNFAELLMQQHRAEELRLSKMTAEEIALEREIERQNRETEYWENSIEGFWSMVKRGIYGVYHWASAKHINKYLNEYSRKYNTKELTNSERFYNFFGNINHKITYKQLISA